MSKIIAAILGGLVLALLAGVAASLMATGAPLERIVAGAFITPLVWVAAMLIALLAPNGRTAWLGVGAAIALFAVVALVVR